jgi:hypothetical protein
MKPGDEDMEFIISLYLLWGMLEIFHNEVKLQNGGKKIQVFDLKKLCILVGADALSPISGLWQPFNSISNSNGFS